MQELALFVAVKIFKVYLFLSYILFVFSTFSVFDSPFKIVTTAKRCEGRTDTICIVILSLNNCVEDVYNKGITKRLIVAFWKALGEKKSNLLEADIRVSCI